MAGTSSANCLSCRVPYQRLHSLNAWTPFSQKVLFFTDFCFVASPSQISVPASFSYFSQRAAIGGRQKGVSHILLRSLFSSLFLAVQLVTFWERFCQFLAPLLPLPLCGTVIFSVKKKQSKTESKSTLSMELGIPRPESTFFSLNIGRKGIRQGRKKGNSRQKGQF